MNSTNAKSLLEDISDAVQCQYMAFVLKVQGLCTKYKRCGKHCLLYSFILRTHIV